MKAKFRDHDGIQTHIYHNGIQTHTYTADSGMLLPLLLSNRFKQQLGACDKLPLWHEWGETLAQYIDSDMTHGCAVFRPVTGIF